MTQGTSQLARITPQPYVPSMVVEKVHLTVDGAKVMMFRIDGLVKLGESAEFFLWAAVEQEWSTNIVINIQNIDYIDTTGIGEFVGVCVALARTGRHVAFLNPPDPTRRYSHGTERVERMIRVAHATDEIQVFTDEQEALAAAAVGFAPHKNSTHPNPLRNTKPRFKPELKIVPGSDLYVVIHQYRNGTWGVADIWHKLPYVSSSLKQANEYRKDIYELASFAVPRVWKKKSFAIQKFSPSPHPERYKTS